MKNLFESCFKKNENKKIEEFESKKKIIKILFNIFG